MGVTARMSVRRTFVSVTANTAQPAQASGTLTLGGELTVNRLGFGAMRLTGKGVWGPPADRDECVRVLRRAVELGVNFIDTADSYGPYISEDIIHEALYPYDGLVIATKAGLLRTGPDVWIPLGNPSYLRQECEMSLRRLGVETIDLFQLHRRPADHADRVGAEHVQPGRSHRRTAAGCRDQPGHRLHPVVPAGRRTAGRPRRSAAEGCGRP